jgi:GlpG protein
LRQIGTLATENEARALRDHLLTLGMTTRVEQRADGWAVWVFNEDHVATARQELSAFLNDPDDPRYHAAAKTAQTLRRESEQLQKQYRKNFVDLGARWDAPAWRRRPLTAALIATSVIVSIATQFGSHLTPLLRHLLLVSYSIDDQGGLHVRGLEALRHGEVWRLITPIFIHFNFMHLLFNMWMFWDLGRLVEARRGMARLAVLVFVPAIASNLGQYLVEGPSLFGGMSGVVYALFGYVWIKSYYEPEQGMLIHPNTVVILLAWFLICLLVPPMKVANTVHAVGLVSGMAFGLARF